MYVHDATEIPPFPLLFFGGDISVQRDGDQETIAVDKWIVFQAPTHIAELVKVLVLRIVFKPYYPLLLLAVMGSITNSNHFSTREDASHSNSAVLLTYVEIKKTSKFRAESILYAGVTLALHVYRLEVKGWSVSSNIIFEKFQTYNST